MAASTNVYGNFPLKAAAKTVDWLNDTIKVALATSSYSPNANTHVFFSDITNEVAASGGYTAGGVTLGSKTLTEATKVTTFGAANASWASSTITARYAIIYDAQTGVTSTEPLIAWVDFGADQSSSSGTFTIQWNASGILTATVA